MNLLNEILDKSKEIDNKFINISSKELNSLNIVFKVPKNHPRAKIIKKYNYSSLKLEELKDNKLFLNSKETIFIVDKNLMKIDFVKEFLENNKISLIILESLENEVKTIPFVEKIIKEKGLENKKDSTIFVIGGGLLINVGAYLAEKTNSNLILFPTTILSMADGSGGKVRINLISQGKAHKHFYKSFYEPNAIFLDERFLDNLPEKQIKIGLVESIKHSIFQSPKLYDYLVENKVKVIKDKRLLKKVVLWASDLKRICLEIDVEETPNGSKKILRGGHDFSDKLEEDEKLSIPHGLAVAIGIIKQLEQEKNQETLDKAKNIFRAFGIPISLREYLAFK